MSKEVSPGRAFIQSYAGCNAALWSRGKPTKFLGEFERQLSQIADLRLVVLDNVALLFDGNENDRIDVTKFLNALNGIARRLRVAVVLTTHVSKSYDGSTLRAASGSTAWVNAARSVLRLEKDEDDRVTLRLVKANHTKPGEEIHLVWQNSVLVASPTADGVGGLLRRQQLDALILETCQKHWEVGNPLADVKNQGDRYLPRVIARQTEFTFKEAKEALVELIDKGYLLPSQPVTPRGRKGLKVIQRPEKVRLDVVVSA